MALIKCPDCGKMFSEYADHCPICGCPILEAKKEKMLADIHAEPKGSKYFGYIVSVIVVFGIVIPALYLFLKDKGIL